MCRVGLHNLLLMGLLLIEMLVLACDANTLAFPMSLRWPTSYIIMIRQWTHFGPSSTMGCATRMSCGPVEFLVSGISANQNGHIGLRYECTDVSDELVLAHSSQKHLLNKPSHGPTSYTAIIRQLAHFGPSGIQWAAPRVCRVGLHNLLLTGFLLIEMLVLARDANTLAFPKSSRWPIAARSA